MSDQDSNDSAESQSLTADAPIASQASQQGESSIPAPGGLDDLTFPPAPDVVVRLARLAEPSNDELARIIESDAALAGSVLMFANAPLMGLSDRVTSIRAAIGVFGAQRFQTIAMTFSVLSGGWPTAHNGIGDDRFWSESLACGVAACVLAQFTKSCNPDAAFSAGLLSRTGRLVLAKGSAEQYALVIQRAVNGNLVAAEREVFGVTPAEVAARLLKQWQFPTPVWQAITEFDQVTPASRSTGSSLATVLHVADMVAQTIDASATSAHAPIERLLGATDFFLRISEQSWAPIFDEIVRRWRECGQLLTIPTHNVAPFQALQAQTGAPMQLLDKLNAQPRSAQATARPTTEPSGSARSQDRPQPQPPSISAASSSTFVPRAPQSVEEAGLSPEEVERLVCKMLLAKGSHAGRAIAEYIGLPFSVVEKLLTALKTDLILAYKDSAPFNDYEYALTDAGRERARRYLEECSYLGTAPVTLGDYVASVQAQSIADIRVGEPEVRAAFADIFVNQKMLRRIGRAVNSGRGMFLYGSPGNGKTSIAERITGCFGSKIWIPRAISVDGDILRVYDPAKHEAAENDDTQTGPDNSIDRRWIQIGRPTIVAGGELTMAELEVQHNPVTKISETPLQLKSNCGALVIDDFGRQRMSADELLNRWIVPLEKRYDFLNLANGKKVQVPFDQLIIFSTNLEPRELVDEAFLRRIPYKIHVDDPSLEEFQAIFAAVCQRLGFSEHASACDYLVEHHYKGAGRPLRCCHPRDLLLQVCNDCAFRASPLELTPAALDAAVEDYFAML